MVSPPASGAAVQPTGTVTFMFTDIEGSTQRWERDRAAMEDAVRRHDAMMREAIAAHGGHVFKTIGDAFCAAFARPEDAADATIAAQLALAAADFSAVDGVRVRMALHTGTTDERDGDYFGPAVNRVARLLAIGHGGQVLLSGVTAALVQGALAQRATLIDLGEHRLKDLSRPEDVHQLVIPTLAAKFPPLRSLQSLPNNLPLRLTSFIGRETEVAEITELLAKNRLVTIVGSGGVGKTRISLQVAANLLDGRADGVWFIELAPLASGDYIAPTVATALGLTLPHEGDPVEHLVRGLGRKQALIVFDNCEHLIEATARVVAAIIGGCPHVAILASSRQGLGIAGETTYRMPALAVPPRHARDGNGSLAAAEAATYSAIALFADRARATERRFELTDDNAPIVADICSRLDGIALAIELAAARVKMLSPRQLRDKLDERFRVLTGGSRDALPRQQTLRALIDWSHDLLDEREKALFRRLSVFVDGFTIEGATAVGCDEDCDEFDVLDLLSSLVDKSLVLTESSADALRYRMLESTRAYARERLEASGEREAVARLRLRYFVDRFVEISEREEALSNPGERTAIFAVEVEDVRAALEDALHSDPSSGARLLNAIDVDWESVGAFHEMRTRAKAFLEAVTEDDLIVRAVLLAQVAYYANRVGRMNENLEAATAGLAVARRSGDARTLARLNVLYGNAMSHAGRFDEADVAFAEAEQIPEIPLRRRLAILLNRAWLAKVRGDANAAESLYERVLTEGRRAGVTHTTELATSDLAEVYHEVGKTPRAIDLTRELLVQLRSTKGTADVMLLANLSAYLCATGAFDEALRSAREAVEVVLATDPASALGAIVLEPLALAVAVGGDPARAAILAGYADAELAKAGYRRGYTEQTTHDRLCAILVALAPNELERALAEGAALSPEAAFAAALERSPLEFAPRTGRVVGVADSGPLGNVR